MNAVLKPKSMYEQGADDCRIGIRPVSKDPEYMRGYAEQYQFDQIKDAQTQMSQGESNAN
ncbi:MAG: hypothetical protein KGI54_18075 [Pseudomonadota bacterium]|nr:hypothetical protein [Pseudomonadota bacterium]